MTAKVDQGKGTITQIGEGVKLNAPPPALMGSVMSEIEKAVSSLPPGTNGAFLAVGDLSGVNASIVTKAPGGFKVQAWVGKTWKGPVNAGVRVLRTW
jgi:hypothetical protein